MARKLRSREIDYDQCRTYHIVTRCVRSLNLLGKDDGQRKERLLQHLAILSDATAVNVAGFALMDNSTLR